MKTKLLLWAVILLLPHTFYSQIIAQPSAVAQPGNPPVGIQNTLLLPFSELDKSKIETGILLDAGIQCAGLNKHNKSNEQILFTLDENSIVFQY